MKAGSGAAGRGRLSVVAAQPAAHVTRVRAAGSTRVSTAWDGEVSSTIQTPSARVGQWRSAAPGVSGGCASGGATASQRRRRASAAAAHGGESFVRGPGGAGVAAPCGDATTARASAATQRRPCRITGQCAMPRWPADREPAHGEPPGATVAIDWDGCDRCSRVTTTVEHFAARLADQHRELAAQWLMRLDEVIDIDVRQVFPSHTLLDHIPKLILEIAGYLGAPQIRRLPPTRRCSPRRVNWALRFDQRASVHQLLREDQYPRRDARGVLRARGGGARCRRRGHRGADGGEPGQPGGAGAAAAHRDAFIARYTAAIERQTTRLRSFSHLVSHEIRQPLQVLQGLARVLSRLTEDPEAAQLIGSLERNVVRLSDVASKLERLARLTRTSEVALNEQSVNLSTLAADVARQLADMADARGVRFEVADALPTLQVDSGRAELVTMNLLANAVKYSDPEKADRVVRVHRDPSVPHPRVVVSDNGLGIPRSKLDAIFEQFVRVHAQLDDELGAHGLGLGLSIVRESMEAMGGTVSVTSDEGRGTTFVLDWPATTLATPRPTS